MASLLERLASRGIHVPAVNVPAVKGVQMWATDAAEDAALDRMKQKRAREAALPAPPAAKEAHGIVVSRKQKPDQEAPVAKQQRKRKQKEAALAEDQATVDAGSQRGKQQQTRARKQPPPEAPVAAAGEKAASVTSGKRAKKHAPASSSPPQRRPATPQRRPSSSMRGTMSPRSFSFNVTSETCSICCDDVPASKAVRLRCSHGWYCMQCMARHVEARLDNGSVQQTCPECSEELAERDLKRTIPAVLMDRLLARSLEQAVAATADLRPCPTPNCPMRVALEADDSGEFQCTVCEKVSCLRCGAQPYHKRLTCEQYKAKQKTERSSLVKWMEKTGTKQCPSCQMGVTKQNLQKQKSQSAECHKMLCRNCGTRFCFKCLAVLTAEYTCGCTKDKHGFVDPDTGEYVQHLKPPKKGKRPSTTREQAGADANDQHDWRDRAGGA